MTLQELIRILDQLEHGLTIYAAYPWEPSSMAIVARPRADGRVPDEAVAAGCRYFLEVHIALHFRRHPVQGAELTEAEACAKLIEYAEFVNSKDKPYPFLKFNFPVNMMIYCSGCRKLFDIVVQREGSREYRCPACAQVQQFDLAAFTTKAIEQSRAIHRKPRGGR